MAGTRRAFLGSVASAGLAAIAGCSGIGGGGARAESPVERWTPTGEAGDGAGGDEVFSVDYRSYAELLEHRAILAGEVVDRLDAARDNAASQYGLQPEWVEEYFDGSPGWVYRGSFDVATVQENTFLGAPADTYRGYQIHPRYGTHAVADGTYVVGHDREGAEALIDAVEGKARRVSDDETFALAAAVTRGATVAGVTLFPDPIEQTVARRGRIAGMVGQGGGMTVRTGQTELTFRLVFESEEAVDRDAFRDVLLKNEGIDEYAFGEPTVEGRAISVTGTIETSEFDGLQAGSPGEE